MNDRKWDENVRNHIGGTASDAPAAEVAFATASGAHAPMSMRLGAQLWPKWEVCLFFKLDGSKSSVFFS